MTGAVHGFVRQQADTRETVDALRALGLNWRPSGQASLHGPLRELAESVDAAFVGLAEALWGAQQEWHPAALTAEGLQRVDYLHSFPHQATFPVRLDPREANLEAFRAGPMVTEDGSVALIALAPTDQVLTPAACHHVYADHEGESLTKARYVTTRNTCFRQEEHYEPLRRQWSFSMREIVCLGSRAEAGAFLSTARLALDQLFKDVDLPVAWLNATDPFFRPPGTPRRRSTRLQPTKYEAVYGGDLPIASVNLHYEHFGAGFGITRGGSYAHSACAAFGIERWLFALTDRHGTDPVNWPDLPAAAVRAAERLTAVRRRGRCT
ncbi:hypothetical protein [Actinocrinis sp.]|uniref:hypothetical protein n=1 Tax=Actinocrinis sp. TaxID=1920516 RepID=UPI002D5CBD9D|nr:hypothetical protein [Actinocrinis sp.]HZP54795.1 hypothetical protein [Actinocrinis sp.]